MRMSIPPGGRDDDESVATSRAALDAGVTFINTGDFYGSGHNETVVGRALRGRREEAFVSVKFGAMLSPAGQFLGFDARPAAVKNVATYSLQRLGIDVIDLYQPGRVDPAVPIEDTVGAIAELIEGGKVRHVGLSEADSAQMRAAHAVHPVTAVEIV
jgi:aryl-alcohol dehydrogenase-like predicted oxidoreductase